MSDTSVISPFQIMDWRIFDFTCVNPIFNIPSDIEHNWKLKAHVDNLDTDDTSLGAALWIEFHFSAEAGSNKMTMDGRCVAMCKMNKDDVPDAEEMFQNLISRVAMTNCLANLRVFLLQAGTLHQMGVKRVMLPFVNLNNFRFDEDLSFTE